MRSHLSKLLVLASALLTLGLSSAASARPLERPKSPKIAVRYHAGPVVVVKVKQKGRITYRAPARRFVPPRASHRPIIVRQPIAYRSMKKAPKHWQ